MKTFWIFRASVALSALTSLTGCGDSGVQEVRQWMEETKRQTRPFVFVVPEPKKFTPFVYGGKGEIDPFNPNKLLAALAKLKAATNQLKAPDMERRREPLEAYPLDALKMVGTLEKPGLQYALLQVDKLIFQAKVGNYVGQNFGMITGVNEVGVEIKEIVQDATGDWVERKAKLELQESKK